MCNICGLNCGKAGALKRHVEGAHSIDYDNYKKCFYGEVKTLIADAWDDSVSTARNNTVITPGATGGLSASAERRYDPHL